MQNYIENYSEKIKNNKHKIILKNYSESSPRSRGKQIIIIQWNYSKEAQNQEQKTKVKNEKKEEKTKRKKKNEIRKGKTKLKQKKQKKTNKNERKRTYHKVR